MCVSARQGAEAAWPRGSGSSRVHAVISPEGTRRIAVDPPRLAILGAAALGPVDAAALADRLWAPLRRVLGAVGGLRGAGLLAPDPGASAPLRCGCRRRTLVDEPWTAERAPVLGRSCPGGRLVQIPAGRTATALPPGAAGDGVRTRGGGTWWIWGCRAGKPAATGAARGWDGRWSGSAEDERP